MIEIKGLSKTYHNKYNDVLAVDNLNLRLGNEGMVFVYGESGEGKSTLLNILAGLDTYDSGHVIIDGTELKGLNASQMDAYRCNHMDFVFEEHNLIETLSVAENIKLCRRIDGKEPSDKEVADILKKLGLAGFEKRLPYELSSGQKQRVSIARTILGKPKILFVDEPTGHLDRENSRKIWDIIKNVSKKCLVIAVSHEKYVVDDYADRIIEIRGGQIYRDVYKKPDLKEKDANVFKNNKTKAIELTKKGKLSARTINSLAFSNLGVKKARTAGLIILSCVSLLFFSLLFLLNSYKSSQVLAKSAFLQDLDYVTFQKDNGVQVLTQDISAIYNQENEDDFYKEYEVNYAIPFANYGISINVSDHKYSKISGIIEINAPALGATKNIFGQKILFGTYPKNTQLNNIVISDYMAALMNRYGIYVKSGSTSTLFQNMGFSYLIGKDITIDGKDYTISAIYETDYKEYMNDDLVLYTAKKETFKYNLENIYSVIHVAPGFINERVYDATTLENVNVLFSKDNIQELRTTQIKIADEVESEHVNIPPQFSGKTEPASYEVVLSYDIYNTLFSRGITAETFDDANIFANIESSFVWLNVNNSSTIKYTLVGLTDLQNTIIVCENSGDVDGTIAEIAKLALFPSNKIVCKTSSVKNLEKTIENLENVGFSYSSQYSEKINQVSDTISIIRIVFLVSSILTALYAAFFMYVFLTQLIRDRKKDIGVLRAVGASTADITKVFLLSSAIVTAICYVLSIILTMLASVVLNIVMSLQLGIPFQMFNFGLATFLLLLAICVAVVFISSILPIMLFSKEPPVDVIKKF